MREVTVSEKCTGCGACYNICPSAAIEMRENNDGFLFPVINQEKCTDCGLCKKTCPALKTFSEYLSEKEPDFVYAAGANDNIRNLSSSGGIFTLLAQSILSEGGYICGAAFSDDFMSVKHIIISEEKDLEKLRSSKYVQSDTNTVYKEIESLLKQNKLVLFSGTPCQVDGLKNYLRKDYGTLLTVDLLCHSTPSPGVWRKYLQEEKKDREIKSINFRSKAISWNKFCFEINYTNGDILRERIRKNWFTKAFLADLISRKSCEACKYTSTKRVSDITIGDFWRIRKFDRKLDDDKGCSLVLTNTPKGNLFLEKIKNDLQFIRKVPIEYAIRGNVVLNRPHKPNKDSLLFFKKFNQMSVIQNIKNIFSNKYDGVIANFWDSANNYGATLTGYALQRYLLDKGLDCRLLSISPQRAMRNKNSFVRKFAEKNLYITQHVKNQRALSKLNQSAEIFIVGSDQIFKAHCMKKYFNQFLLPYTDFSKRRIAFSASFGKDSFDADDRDKYIISKYLKRFDGISVREDSGVNICKNDFGIEAVHILDPVFLVDREQFLKFVDKNCEKYKDKLVCMVLDSSKDFRQAIDRLSKELNTEVINILGKNLSIEEFLTAIYTSKYFLTDSFHGTCFAILFHKNFITLKNEDRGKARFDSLVNTFNMEECFVRTINELSSFKFNQNHDWEKVEEKISSEKQKADNWLAKILSSQRTAEMVGNEFDVMKYSKEKLFKRKITGFSKTQIGNRTTIRFLGIKISFKRK